MEPFCELREPLNIYFIHTNKYIMKGHFHTEVIIVERSSEHGQSVATSINTVQLKVYSCQAEDQSYFTRPANPEASWEPLPWMINI